MAEVNLHNANCMDYLSKFKDNEFNLAIVDVPYGIREDGHRENNRSKLAKSKKYHKALWNQKRPTKEYFKELQRISVNQIIWGANHLCDLFDAKSSCWIVWDKNNGINHFADCELAYGSFETAVRKFKFTWNGMLQGDMKNKQNRIHPTEKPIKLYEWLLMNYAKEGDKILDTHLGSMSIAIACHNLGFDLTGFEIDKEYFDAGMKRLKIHQSQIRIYAEKPTDQPKQKTLFE